ncbi:peptidoglycan editing factor PgeF [Bacteroides sp. 519]|uniref:peptidoglycan editing factor PgeF n=1 Tax=Bacteroides sp. 519 TaxID=2302937 RepID=UPI0013D74DEC|nr:peptidoglycan editing factor PgeF [Bacteroides sp. 519]NDV59169.1 peptidoglycan editing factor PgeF [Bacteroides sp. 519]
MIPLTNDKRMLGYELLNSYPNISHFVTTRLGGCSKGNYASFNCTHYTGDDLEDVYQNQQLLIDSLACRPSKLVIPRQTHNTEVRIITSPVDYTDEALQGVDALITNQPGYCLCISTADCIPVLLYDYKENVVAAIHAGWRGTVEGIVAKTLQLMQQTYHSAGENIIACIGPGISVASFEVGNEVYEAFQKKGFDMNKVAQFNQHTKKYHIDLWEANRMQLKDFGIPDSQIECAEICTYHEHNLFFSARRLGIHSGRILSGIMINS